MDNYFFYTDILMALSFAFITFFSHYFFEKNIAKSISPGIFFVLHHLKRKMEQNS